MDALHNGKRFLLDGDISRKALERAFKEEALQPPAFKRVPPGEFVELSPGEELVTGKASQFLHTLRHKPGEIIESAGRKYMVMNNGEWRRVDK